MENPLVLMRKIVLENPEGSAQLLAAKWISKFPRDYLISLLTQAVIEAQRVHKMEDEAFVEAERRRRRALAQYSKRRTSPTNTGDQDHGQRQP